MYKLLVRPFLFLFDPEKIHHFTFNSIRNIFKIPGIKSIAKSIHTLDDPKLEKELFGLKFKILLG